LNRLKKEKLRKLLCLRRQPSIMGELGIFQAQPGGLHNIGKQSTFVGAAVVDRSKN
jgi:hypothetical protein